MQTSYDKENAVYGGFFSRLAAFLIDNIVISCLLFFIKFAVWIVKLSVGADVAIFKPILFEYDLFAIMYYLITVSYFIIATYFCGTTVGKHLMKLKVVDVNGEKMTFISVVIRETVGRYLSALIIYVGYFMIGLDTRKQALHDKISDTCVIYTHKFPMNRPVQRVAAPNPAPNPAPEKKASNYQEEMLQRMRDTLPKNPQTAPVNTVENRTGVQMPDAEVVQDTVTMPQSNVEAFGEVASTVDTVTDNKEV